MQTSNLFWLGLFYFKIFKMTTTPSAGGQNMADSKAGMFDVAKRCIEILSINFKLLTGLTYLRSAILDLATEHNTSIKARNPIISFFKTKQQEFIHPLILSPTHAKNTKLTKNPKKSSLFSILFFLAKTNCLELTILSKRKNQPNQPNRS